MQTHNYSNNTASAAVSNGAVTVAETPINAKEGGTNRPTFKILCLDGGGFKGLSTATVLAVIENYHSKSFLDQFDMICGTSTGGLIALALAAGKRADEIENFYKDYGTTIFPPLNAVQRVRHNVRMLTNANKHKYSDEGLRRAVEAILGERQIRDSRCFLCIPALNFTTFKPRVFKTDHNVELSRDSLLLMSDVALATSAAPTFFPLSTCGKSGNVEYFADGGMWANNPSLIGLTEAMRFFVGPDKPYGGVSLLSIGCAAGVAGRLGKPVYSRWGHNFASEMIEAAGEAQQLAALLHIQHLRSAFCVPVDFTRIDIGPLSPAQAKAVALDSATTDAIQLLTQLGTEAGHKWKTDPAIKALFAQPAPKIGLPSHS